MTDLWFALARAGLSALFLVSGYNAVTNVAGVATMLAGKGFPQPTAMGYAVAALEIGFGLLVLVGFKTRWAALVLLLFSAGTIVLFHNFWAQEGLAKATNQIHALKNVAIMGGLLLLALVGPGRFSLDRR
jgi:putative oxidoreductase